MCEPVRLGGTDGVMASNSVSLSVTARMIFSHQWHGGRANSLSDTHRCCFES